MHQHSPFWPLAWSLLVALCPKTVTLLTAVSAVRVMTMVMGYDDGSVMMMVIVMAVVMVMVHGDGHGHGSECYC